jgi:hypothetical protein
MKRLLMSLMALGLTVSARADLLIAWDFATASSTTPPLTWNATTVDALLATTVVTRGLGLTATGNTNGFAASSMSAATLGAAITSNDYFSWTVAGEVGSTFSITGLVFYTTRSATGPTNMTLRSSADAFVADLFTATAFGTGNLTNNVNTSGVGALQNISSVEFRLYGYTASSSAGTLRLEEDSTPIGNDLSVFGTAIPEPSTLALCGVALLGLASRRWLTRRK